MTKHTMTLLMAGVALSAAGCCYYPQQPTDQSAAYSATGTASLDSPYSPYTRPDTEMKTAASAASDDAPRYQAIDTGETKSVSSTGLDSAEYAAAPAGSPSYSYSQPSGGVQYYDNLRTFQVVNQ